MQSVAVSPHVRVRMTPRGQGSIAAAPPGWSLSVDGGDPGPGRRLRGEGLGRSPRAASRLLPASGRPASASPGPGPHRTQTLAPAPRRPRAARGLGRDRAIGGGEAFQRPPGSAPPPPPPPPDTKPVRGPARPRGPSSPPWAPAGGFVGPGDTAEAARLFLLLFLALLPLLLPLSPRPRQEARKRSGGGEGLGGLPLFSFCSAPQAALRPAPSAGDTSAPGTMADAAWLRESAQIGRAHV